MAQLALHLTASVLVAYSLLSLMEYLIHRHVMHRPALARAFKNHKLREAFTNHAVLHHKACFAVFHHERDPCAIMNIAIDRSTSLLIVSLTCLLVFSVDALTSLLLLLGALAHSRLWSEVHAEMHRPQGTWFCNTWIFSYLKRWHYLHHRHPGKNFNALLPMWDWVLGTVAIETEADRREMAAGTWRVRL